MRLGNIPPEIDADTRLHRAARDGNMSTVRELLASGIPPNSLDNAGFTPLHFAAAEEHKEVIELLVGLGADINGQADGEGWQDDTPLGHVADTCSLELAELLLKLGADPTTSGWMGITPIDRAADRGGDTGKRLTKLFLETSYSKSLKL